MDCNSLYTAVARVILYVFGTVIVPCKLASKIYNAFDIFSRLSVYIHFSIILFWLFFQRPWSLSLGTIFICILYRSLYVCNLSTVSCNFSLLCSIISMSSANLRLFTRLPWTLTPLFSLFLILSHYSLQEQSKWSWWQWIDSLYIINCHLKPFTQMSFEYQ